LRFQEQVRLDSSGTGVLRLKSEEPVGACGRVLWDAWLGPIRVGTVEARAAVDRQIDPEIRVPIELPTTELEQRQVLAHLQDVYKTALSRLTWDSQIARHETELERRQAERLAARIRELQATAPGEQRAAEQLRQEIGQTQEAIRALQAERDRLDAELALLRTSPRASAVSVPGPFEYYGAAPSATNEQWQNEIGSMSQGFAVRLDESVSEIAWLQAESHSLRVGPSQENKRKILELEAAATPEQKAAGEFTWQLHELHQARNDLQLETERQKASLTLGQLKSSH